MIAVNIAPLAWEWSADTAPFPHAVIENFFHPSIARQIAAEFPAFDSDAWHEYANALEVKRTCNNRERFGPVTKQAFEWLNSAGFAELLRLSIGAEYPLYCDPDLHGGGLHYHGPGGKLNVHLDYSLHPRLGLARKLNLLVYVNPNWRDEWGGGLGLYEAGTDGPGPLAKSIEPRFNRAVLFQTTNAWHGLPEPIACPEGQARQSLAVYYLTDPTHALDSRSRALFAPAPEQQGDPEVIDLIARRANEATAASVHRTPARTASSA